MKLHELTFNLYEIFYFDRDLVLETSSHYLKP